MGYRDRNTREEDETMTQKEKLVLVGNGMAGVNAVEHLLKLAPDKYEVTILGVSLIRTIIGFCCLMSFREIPRLRISLSIHMNGTETTI